MDSEIKKPSKSGAGCLTLFGAVFLLFGLGAGASSLVPVYKSLTSGDWQTTQATVLEAKLERHRGDDTTTYKATGKYQYEWNGQTYTSEQINFNSGSDNIGSYQRDLANKLKRAKSSKQNIQAWVNPDSPSEAVIDKDIRWGGFAFKMLFFVLFGGVGAGIMLAGRYSKKAHKREVERSYLYPNEPWRWRDQWQTPEIKNSSKAILWTSLVFAVIWNLISSPILFILPEEIAEKKNYIALVALLFPLVGIGLAVWAFKNYQRWKRFKDTAFTLDTYPAMLGNRLQGTLRMAEQLPMDTQFKVQLSCIHKYTSGSGKNSSTREDVLWQDEQHIPISAGSFSDNYYLPLQFRLPTDKPISKWDESRSQHIWRLNIESEIEGTDFKQDFELPVIANDGQTSDDSLDTATHEDRYADKSVYTYEGDWQKTDAEYTFDGRTHNYFFAPARHKGTASMISLMTLIFGGVGVAGFVSEKMPIFFGIVFGLFGLGLAYASLRLWLHKIELDVNEQQLIVRSGMVSGKEERFNSQDIKKLSMKSTMSSGNVQFYDIFAEPHISKKIRIGSALLGRRDVEALMQKISAELGIKEKPEFDQ